MLNWNPEGDYPEIDNTAYIDRTAVIIGKVKIGKNVFIGPDAVLRADEPRSSITINDNCNVQDRVIIHVLENSSVLIEENTSLTHGCIIHGPCKIAENCFIGFGSVVFKSNIGEGVCVKHLAVVEGVDIPPGKIVDSSHLIDNKDKVDKLRFADNAMKSFAKNVINANLHLVKSYNAKR